MSEGGGPTLFKIGAKADGLKQTALGTLTGEKTFALEFEKAPVSADDVLGSIGQGAASVKAVLP